jgi:Neprosin
VLVDVDGARSPVAIGYYPDSDFGGGFGTAAFFKAGCEVEEQAAVPNDAFFTLPMGSGAPASAGEGSRSGGNRAASVSNLGWISTTGRGDTDNGGFGKPISNVPAKYGAWQNPNPGMDELGVAFYCGGPVPPPPPPPPPPPCPASGPDPQDRFFPDE